MTAERLQKILAQAGYGSRRSCEDFITAGRVRVNGQIASLGQKAGPTVDRIMLDGKSIPAAESLIYIALHKPRNVLSTVETERGDTRQTVRELVDTSGHLYPVGRLDFESEGLVLMTNDGELSNLLTHPRYGHEKEYRVLLAKRPDQEQLEVWKRGVVLEDGHKTAPVEVRFESTQGKGAWVNVVMREGRKRQIRETCKQLGLPVVRIVRVRIGPLRLGTGDTPGCDWSTITGIQVELGTNSETKAAQIHIDDLWLEGGYGQDSSDVGGIPYEYVFTHYDPRTGAESNPSPSSYIEGVSDELHLLRCGTTVSISGLSYGDSNMRQRFYRKGGTLTDTFYYIGTNISDGASLSDSYTDTEIMNSGAVSYDHDVPVTTQKSDGDAVYAQPIPLHHDDER